MSIRTALFVAVAAGLSGAAAMAQTPAVDSARAAGLVGERFDGYLGIVGPVSSPVRAAVGAINIKRRALYSDLASRRGVAPQEVGITAGCELFARVGDGQAYLLNDGVWRRRSAGQPAPRPGYCG